MSAESRRYTRAVLTQAAMKLAVDLTDMAQRVADVGFATNPDEGLAAKNYAQAALAAGQLYSTLQRVGEHRR